MSQYVYAVKAYLISAGGIIINFHRVGIGIVAGMMVCVFLVAVCSADDCGCGGFDTSPSDYGWNSPGYSGPDISDNSNGGSTPDSAGGEASDSGGSPTADNSITDSGSSDGSSTGSSGGISGSESSSDSALLLAVSGTSYYHQGDLNQSLSVLNKSLFIDPYSSRAWMTKGDVLSAMRRYEEAIVAYSQVLHLDPSDGSAAAKRGDAYMNAGNYPEAIASYDRALAMNPGLLDVQVNRSIAKQLASGVIRANLTVAEPTDSGELISGRDLIAEPVPGTTTSETTVPQSNHIPGTLKAGLSLPVLLTALMMACFISVIFRKR
jgi:hypothetical protein